MKANKELGETVIIGLEKTVKLPVLFAVLVNVAELEAIEAELPSPRADTQPVLSLYIVAAVFIAPVTAAFSQLNVISPKIAVPNPLTDHMALTRLAAVIGGVGVPVTLAETDPVPV